MTQSKLRRIGSEVLKPLKKVVEKAVAFSVALPWMILILFAVLTVFFGMKTTSLKFETNIDNLATKSASEIKEIELAARDFSIWEPLYLVLVGDTRKLETWKKIAQTTANLRKVENVSRALSPLDSTYITLQGFSIGNIPVASAVPSSEGELKIFFDNLSRSFDSRFSVSSSGDAVVVRLYIRGGLGSRGKKAIDGIQKILQDEWGDGGYYLTGELFLGYSVDKTVVADVMILFPLAIAVVFMVTILSFRSVSGVLAPTLTVLSTVVVTLGFMAMLGKPLTIISAILPVLLIAMSSADSIHIFSRYREEISRGSQKRQAITQSMSSMVLPVVMTSLTTAAGFGSLIFSSIIPMKELGYFSVFGIIYAMLFSLLAVPAVLSSLPAPRVDIAASRNVEEPFMDKLLYRFSVAVAKKRRIVLLISIAVALVCIVGITNVQFESNLSRYFRKGSAVSRGVTTFEDRFGGSSLLIIAVDSGREGGVMTVDFIRALGEMEKVLDGFDILSRTSSFHSLVGSIYPGELNQGQITLIKSGVGSSGVQGYVSKDSSKAAIHTYIRNTSTREISRTLVRVERELLKVLPAGHAHTHGYTTRHPATHGELRPEPGGQPSVLGDYSLVHRISYVPVDFHRFSRHATTTFHDSFQSGNYGIDGNTSRCGNRSGGKHIRRSRDRLLDTFHRKGKVRTQVWQLTGKGQQQSFPHGWTRNTHKCHNSHFGLFDTRLLQLSHSIGIWNTDDLHDGRQFRGGSGDHTCHTELAKARR